MDANLHSNNSDVNMPNVIPTDAPLTNDRHTASTYEQCVTSDATLCFISYRGADTVTPKWYLVQVRKDNTSQPTNKDLVV